ncbi:helix-turn-helix domain-containing protein [Nocardia sp. NPDC059239]|uniref:helix-turn-helix domain-containing protein n=1 Tax=unclassified Nocardia TaxID=2637762 RepID=UPI0036A45104
MVEVEWTAREIRALRIALKESRREFAKRLRVSKRTITLWEDGITRRLQAASVRMLDDVLAGADTATRSRFEALAQASASAGSSDDVVTDHGGDSTNRRDALRILGIGGAAATGLRYAVLAAAHDSALLTSVIDRSPVEPTTMSECAETLHRLATDYVLCPDLDRIFVELTVLRDRLAAVIQRAGKLSDLQQLYVLLAATCTLLASVSHDLAEPHAAMIQTDSAAAFARLAGHRSLENWVYCTRAMIASWWEPPARVLEEAGKAITPHGISHVRLSGLVARAHSQIGNRSAAFAAMDAARRERDRLPEHESLTDLGPVFAFSLARQHYYDATAYAQLREWTRAKSEAENVISLYAPTSTQTWSATLTLARVTLARADLHLTGPDAALAHLEPVLAIPAGQRIPQVKSALNGIRSDLAGLAATPDRRTLGEAVRMFTPRKEPDEQ